MPSDDASQLWLDDFCPGDRYLGRSRIIDDRSFRLFAEMTGDAHPIHYDEAYAASTPLGGRVAHGLLVMSMTALGAAPLSARLEASMIAFVAQEGRFIHPVRPGDEIVPSFTVAEIGSAHQGRGRITFDVELTNQHGQMVLSGRHTYLLRSKLRRSGAP